MKKAKEKLNINSPVNIVLECDGTRVEEEEYFSTLVDNTCFMILREDENWIPPSENYLWVPKHAHENVSGTSDATSNAEDKIDKMKTEILEKIEGTTAELKATIEKTQIELHDLQSAITVTAVCKLIVTKVERLKKKGQLQSKCRSLEEYSEFTEKYNSVLGEYNVKWRKRNADCHEYDTLDEVDIQKIKPHVDRFFETPENCTNFSSY